MAPSSLVTSMDIVGFPMPKTFIFASAVLPAAIVPSVAFAMPPEGTRIRPPSIAKLTSQLVTSALPTFSTVAVNPRPPLTVTSSSGNLKSVS